MLQDTDFFDKLPEWCELGDYHAEVEWSESVSPDERYDVDIVWRFRGKRAGEAQLVIYPQVYPEGSYHPIDYRIFWKNLRLGDDFQGKGLYTNLVKQFSAVMPHYGVNGVVAHPWDKEAERRLASQGFVWDGHEFYLRFQGLSKPS